MAQVVRTRIIPTVITSSTKEYPDSALRGCLWDRRSVPMTERRDSKKGTTSAPDVGLTGQASGIASDTAAEAITPETHSQFSQLRICPASISHADALGSARHSRLPVVGDRRRHRQRRRRSLRGGLVVKRDRGDVSPATADSLCEKLPEIPREKRVATEEADHSSHREEWPERDRILPALPAGGEQCRRQRATDQNREQDAEEHELPAQECPDHGAELHVADAHARLTDDQRAAHDDQHEQAPSHDRSDERVLPSNAARSEAQQQPQDDARQAEHVGDDLMVEVDPRDRDEPGEEDQGGDELRTRAEGQIGKREEGSTREFDRRVAPRDPGLAAATASPEQCVRQQGDVVVPGNRASAPRTRGSRTNDASAGGQTGDHHVQEAANAEAEEEGERQS